MLQGQSTAVVQTMCTGDTMMSLTVANALSDAEASGNAAQHTQSAAPRSGCTIPLSFFFVRAKNISLTLWVLLLFFLTSLTT